MGLQDIKINNKGIQYYIKRYITEITEAAIAYSLYHYFSNTELQFNKIIKASLFIGFITLILEEYNPKSVDWIKNSIIVLIIGIIIKN